MLSKNCCKYTKELINKYTEHIWQASVVNKLQLLGENRVPTVRLDPIPMSLNTPRRTEVKALSFFYKQNLLRSFLYLAQTKKCPTPICDCQEEEQTAHHILTTCNLVDVGLRTRVGEAVARCHDMDVETAADYITILNCSRDTDFINCCIDVVKENRPNLRTDYVIVRNY